MSAARMGKGAVKTPKLSAWVAVDKHGLPVHEGAYQVRVSHTKLANSFSWFDGDEFRFISDSAEDADKNRIHGTGARVTEYRGLASDPAGGAK